MGGYVLHNHPSVPGQLGVNKMPHFIPLTSVSWYGNPATFTYAPSINHFPYKIWILYAKECKYDVLSHS